MKNTNTFIVGKNQSQVSDERSVPLLMGDLRIRVTRSLLPLEHLCGFGTRKNPKRGFLFVSKVLGRHLPVPPSRMRAVYRELACGVPADLPGPVVVIGLAETAIALGQGVHEEYVRRTGRDDVLYIHTTRHRFGRRTCFCEFREEHSHAPNHRLYRAERFEDGESMANCRSLVVVDDEASTGQSVQNLVRAFAASAHMLERVCAAVITDWRGQRIAKGSDGNAMAPHRYFSLLEGEYDFRSKMSTMPEELPDWEVTTQPKDDALPHNFGRFGTRTFPQPPNAWLDNLNFRRGQKILVLGTGEFVSMPFALAERLEAQGVETYCQATTRSPALIGHDIATMLEFEDEQGDGVPNFLYNVRADDYDRIVLCYEAPPTTSHSELITWLRAVPLHVPPNETTGFRRPR